MANRRKAIRDAVVSLLHGSTAAGANVFGGRVYDVPADLLPCIVVFCRDESVVYVSQSQQREQQRTLQLEIVVHVQSVLSVDDALDDLSGVVEHLLDNSGMVDGSFSNVELKSTVIEATQDGAKMLGKAALSYDITYYTIEGA